MPSGRPTGRKHGDWTKRLCVLAAAVAAAGVFGVDRGHADDSSVGLAIAAQAQADAAAAVATALAASSAAIAQAQSSTVVTMEATMNAVPTAAAAPAGAAIATVTDVRPVEPAPSAGASEHAAPRRLARPRKSRPRALPQVRGRPVEREALAVPAPDPVRRGAALRSASGTPTGARPKRRPPAPTRPAPLSPSTPAPGNPGVSWSGQSGGQGAFPTPLPAAIAGFLILAIAFGFRRVIWWARPMPKRVALPPWRPG